MTRADLSTTARIDPGPDLLGAVASFGLPGAPELPSRLEVLHASALVSAAATARLTGPLLAACRAGQVELPGEVLHRLERSHRDSLLHCMRLEHELLDVDDVLQRHQVPFVVLKGPAVAHLDRSDPGDRAWSDIDILVPAGHIDRAVVVLTGVGATSTYAERRPGWNRRFAKSVGLRSADQIEIDVHRTLADGVYGNRIPLDRLFATTETFDLAGRPFRSLSSPARVLHAAYHAVVGSLTPSWTTLRDLGIYFAEPTVPVAEVVAEARRWRGEAVLAEAVVLVRSRLGIEASRWFDWVDDVEVDPRERLLVSRLRHGDAGLSGARLDLIRELPSTSDRIAYIAGLAFPVGAEGSVLRRYRRWLPHVVRHRPVGRRPAPDTGRSGRRPPSGGEPPRPGTKPQR
ncbi:MAG: nucleotidyltransferase family protein [Acidimicrobiales bacterium]|nr:nucleotidyltransferase family protein [Acidimicrobiales bacterium]